MYSGLMEELETADEIFGSALPLLVLLSDLSNWLPELRSTTASFKDIMPARGEKRRKGSTLLVPWSSFVEARITDLSDKFKLPFSLSISFACDADGLDFCSFKSGFTEDFTLEDPFSIFPPFTIALKWLLNKSRGLFFMVAG